MWMTVRAAVVVTACIAGCATAPETRAGKADLEASARQTLRDMTMREPAIQQVLNGSAGYAVFPRIGEGGAIVGGAYGQGVLYEGGRRAGFIKVEQASVGAVLGGKSYSEIVVFRDRDALRDVKDGEYELRGDADVVVLTTGAAATTTFKGKVVAFVMPIGGLMVDVSVAGQRLKYVPAG